MILFFFLSDFPFSSFSVTSSPIDCGIISFNACSRYVKKMIGRFAFVILRSHFLFRLQTKWSSLDYELWCVGDHSSLEIDHWMIDNIRFNPVLVSREAIAKFNSYENDGLNAFVFFYPLFAFRNKCKNCEKNISNWKWISGKLAYWIFLVHLHFIWIRIAQSQRQNTGITLELITLFSFLFFFFNFEDKRSAKIEFSSASRRLLSKLKCRKLHSKKKSFIWAVVTVCNECVHTPNRMSIDCWMEY